MGGGGDGAAALVVYGGSGVTGAGGSADVAGSDGVTCGGGAAGKGEVTCGVGAFGDGVATSGCAVVGGDAIVSGAGGAAGCDRPVEVTASSGVIACERDLVALRTLRVGRRRVIAVSSWMDMCVHALLS